MLLTVLSALLVVYWLILKMKLRVASAWRTYAQRNRVSLNQIELSDDEEEHYSVIRAAHELSWKEARKVLVNHGPEAPEFNYEKEKGPRMGHAIVVAEYLLTSICFLFAEQEFVLLLTYFILALLGTTASPVFYSFHLLKIVGLVNSLKSVTRAVTVNKGQLVLTAMLGLILIYIFGAFGFTFFHDMYYNEDVNGHIDEKGGEHMCTNLLHCVLTTINYGLRNGGGIGESMLPIKYSDRENYYLRAVFDLAFFMIVVIILLNIVFGIIIDSFADLRDKRNAMLEDMLNKCYVCNIERYSVSALRL